ncbi:hypothetical protein GF327_03930 [Candidatus Woesearchaeota archaeon]|nr:hypothetical protein [Candidatus Woesearchaeota archaeon]
MREIIRLLRPYQYYKNLVIFLPLIFGQVLFDVNAFYKTIIGFLCLCLISSVNYIINDLVDISKDKIHPEKRKRPLASGKIDKLTAVIIAVVLFITAGLISLFLSKMFFLFVFSLFVTTQIYTLFFKKEAFVDIIIIAVNFVIRAVSGAFVATYNNHPYIEVSQWLIFSPFFLSLFLSAGKREADQKLLGKGSEKHKEVLKYYNKDITKSLMIISTTLLIIVYSLYIFFSEYKFLIFTLPFSLYVIFRYLYLVESGSEVARHPHKVYEDKRILAGIILWVFLTLVSIYFV